MSPASQAARGSRSGPTRDSDVMKRTQWNSHPRQSPDGDKVPHCEPTSSTWYFL